MDDLEVLGLMDPEAPDLELFLDELVQWPRWHVSAAGRVLGMGTRHISSRSAGLRQRRHLPSATPVA